MLRSLLQTRDDFVPLVLRITLAIVIFPHGAQKMFGWFGGFGFSGTLGYFEQLGIPAFLGVLIIAAEVFGSLGAIVGFLTRIAAAGIGLIMIGAIALVHSNFGFFMNWTGAQQGEGFEFHLLVLGIAIALVLSGSGKASVDGVLQKRWYPAGLSPAV